MNKSDTQSAYLREPSDRSLSLETEFVEMKLMLVDMQNHSRQQSKQRRWFQAIMAGALVIIAAVNVSMALKPTDTSNSASPAMVQAAVPAKSSGIDTNSKGEIVDHKSGHLLATKPEGSQIHVEMSGEYVGRRLAHALGGRQLMVSKPHIVGLFNNRKKKNEKTGGKNIRDPMRRAIFNELPAGKAQRQKVKQMKEDYLKGVAVTVEFEYGGILYTGRAASGARFVDDEDGNEVMYNLKEEGTDGPYFEVRCPKQDDIDASDCEIYEAEDEATDRRLLRALSESESNYESEYRWVGCNGDGRCQNREDGVLSESLPACNLNFPITEGSTDYDGTCGCNEDADCGTGNYCDTDATHPAGVCVRYCTQDSDCRSGSQKDSCMPDGTCGCTVGDYDTCEGSYTEYQCFDTFTSRGTCEPVYLPCLSLEATVEVKGQSNPVSMKDLKIGDYVLTAPDHYEQVYTFGHIHRETPTDFVSIETIHQDSKPRRPLEMTGQHLVFVYGKTNPVRADSIKVGDVLQGQDGTGATVTKVGTVRRNGLYGPLTRDGIIIVDEIVASSYTSDQGKAGGPEFMSLQDGSKLPLPLSHHAGMHLFYSPLRVLCLGVSAEFCQSDTAFTKDGRHVFAAFGSKVSKWVQKQTSMVQAPLFLLIVIPFLTCYIAEGLFGAALAPLLLAAMTVVLLYVRYNKDSIELRFQLTKNEKKKEV